MIILTTNQAFYNYNNIKRSPQLPHRSVPSPVALQIEPRIRRGLSAGVAPINVPCGVHN